jgi:[ribosomal protein S5]-alanine N-acetyltransferase
VIRTDRLELIPLTHAFLAATAAGDRAALPGLVGASVPDDWPGDAPVEFWLPRAADADALPWLARAIVLRETREMIGHAGFHRPPGDPVISRWAPGGVEIGYTVFEVHRGRGYATEAAQGLLDFALERGVRSVMATTALGNRASAAVLRRCGFRHAGRIEEDGEAEDV